MICRRSNNAAQWRPGGVPECTMALRGRRIRRDGIAGPSYGKRNRTGSLMVEMVVCTVLLSVVAAVLVPGIHAVHGQRKATRFDTYALIELHNQATLLRQQGTPSGLQLSPWFADRYAETQLAAEKVSIEEADGNDSAPIKLTITRPSANAKPDVVRSLVVWVPAREESE